MELLFITGTESWEITVGTSSALNFEATPVYTILVEVSDDEHKAEVNVTISVNQYLSVTDILEQRIRIFPILAQSMLNLSFENSNITYDTYQILNLDDKQQLHLDVTALQIAIGEWLGKRGA